MKELSSENSIASVFVSELRSLSIQKDSMRFRRNMERLGEIMAYEISRQFSYTTHSITTPLGNKTVQLPSAQPVLATVMRAGIPFHQGFLNYFDKAASAFIGAARSAYTEQGEFDIISGYMACPNLQEKTLILTDPMLATGKSLEKCLNMLQEYGPPKEIYVASIIASRPGIQYIEKKFPHVHIWTFSVDEELSSHSYIIPGLGDAGDLCYGEKV